MGNQLLNSLKDGAICVSIQTRITKNRIRLKVGRSISLNLFYRDLPLGSESSTAKRKMVCVFNFTIVTELILHCSFATQSIT